MKQGRLVSLKDGKLYSNSGECIHRPSICIDGDLALFFGNEGIVFPKYRVLDESFKRHNIPTDSLHYIPLYERLSAEGCYFVIEVAYSYTASGFLEKLSEVFYTNGLSTWITDERAYKRV